MNGLSDKDWRPRFLNQYEFTCSCGTKIIRHQRNTKLPPVCFTCQMAKARKYALKLREKRRADPSINS